MHNIKETHFGRTLILDKDVKFVGEGDPIDPIKLAQYVLLSNQVEKSGAL